MLRFSANLGFLWTKLALPDAIFAAKAAGFDAVECHWPYDVPAGEVVAALRETGLPVLGLNTRRGDVENGDSGLAALSGREGEARAAIDEAIDYAERVKACHVHVMAGKAQGDEARETFVRNLDYAASMAAKAGLTIVIEPLNEHDAPGYFLNNNRQAADIIAEVKAPNLKLMFDCYHAARTEGDVVAQLEKYLPIIGHIQFAGVPDRGAPDTGDVNYRSVFAMVLELGWTNPLGAEYRPGPSTEASLGWMTQFRDIKSS